VPLDARTLARDLMDAYGSRLTAALPPSARDAAFDLTAAYAVEAELARLRRASGHNTVGRKVGFASKALWRVLKLDTLVWAHMYDDTVHNTTNGFASLSVGRMCSPKIEPEIVFKLKDAPDPGKREPAAVLENVEWLALGFEIIDCPFADWKFQPADFVAAFGLHAALVVGEPHPLDRSTIPTLVERLPLFTVTLFKDGDLLEQGSGKNSLRSPALCLAELASAAARQAGVEPLAAAELVSSGTLTESHPIAPGQTWKAVVEGIDLTDVTLRTID
jgi:2-keto-4-pentenoate hydratase